MDQYHKTATEVIRRTAITLVLFICGISPAIYSQNTDINKIREEIKELEQTQEDLTGTITYFEDTIKKIESGDYIMLTSESNGLTFPVPKKDFTQFMSIKVLTGALTPKRAAGIIQIFVRLTADYPGIARGELKTLTRKLEMGKNRLTYLYDQRARLSESSGAVNLSGTWSMTCCGGKYTAQITLRQTGTTLAGQFDSTSNNSGGTVTGSVSGTSVSFTRSFGSFSQGYQLKLSADGKTLTGTYSGNVDRSAPLDVTMRKQ